MSDIDYKFNQSYSVLFVTKLFDEEVYEVLEKLIGYFERYPLIKYYFIDLKNHAIIAQKYPHLQIEMYQREKHEREIQYVVTIGGDGTILYTAGLFQKSTTPKILAVQKGTLGFLCKFNLRQLQVMAIQAIKDMKQRRGVPNEISLLKLESKMRIFSQNNQRTGNSKPLNYHILNEIVVTKEHSETQLKLEIYLSNKLFTITSGDGLLISTPTGSTAYALSAGGPIVQNQIQTIMITPISPNSLSFRPICLPANVKIKIKVHDKSKINALVICDGQLTDSLFKDETLQIQKSPYSVEVFCQQEQHHLQQWTSKLKQLLNWNNPYST